MSIAEKVSAAVGQYVDRHTVAKDIQYWKAIWREELVDNPRSAKAEELARLNDMEQEVVAQYIATQRASLFDRRMRVIAQRIALLGMDAPTQVGVTVHDDIDPKQVLHDRVATLASRSGVDGGSSVPLN